ncbi:OsmC family protein [Pseudoduganella sp. RAF53_2]|uniref:OsmC family protein n=1 Tax=unclassified Pseudoduganella TaxID=2637179 RepID=UPI003F9AC0B7
MTVKVVRDQSLPMRHVLHVRNHIVSVDGTLPEGGSDAGPNPHDLYDAAISACKALTVVWYAKRKNIPVEDVQVTTERDDSEERKGVYRLTATLQLSGPLTGEQREELLAVAQKCPVHKLMTAVTTEITTLLGQSE